MTQNKFWLVWSPEIHNTSYKYEELKSAKAEAIRLTKDLNKEIYVLEATHHFKEDVEVIETDLNALEADFSECLLKAE